MLEEVKAGSCCCLVNSVDSSEVGEAGVHWDAIRDEPVTWGNEPDWVEDDGISRVESWEEGREDWGRHEAELSRYMPHSDWPVNDVPGQGIPKGVPILWSLRWQYLLWGDIWAIISDSTDITSLLDIVGYWAAGSEVKQRPLTFMSWVSISIASLKALGIEVWVSISIVSLKALGIEVVARDVPKTPGGSAVVELGRLSSISRIPILWELVGLGIALLSSSLLTGLGGAKNGNDQTKEPLPGHCNNYEIKVHGKFCYSTGNGVGVY